MRRKSTLAFKIDLIKIIAIYAMSLLLFSACAPSFEQQSTDRTSRLQRYTPTERKALTDAADEEGFFYTGFENKNSFGNFKETVQKVTQTKDGERNPFAESIARVIFDLKDIPGNQYPHEKNVELYVVWKDNASTRFTGIIDLKKNRKTVRLNVDGKLDRSAGAEFYCENETCSQAKVYLYKPDRELGTGVSLTRESRDIRLTSMSSKAESQPEKRKVEDRKVTIVSWAVVDGVSRFIMDEVPSAAPRIVNLPPIRVVGDLINPEGGAKLVKQLPTDTTLNSLISASFEDALNKHTNSSANIAKLVGNTNTGDFILRFSPRKAEDALPVPAIQKTNSVQPTQAPVAKQSEQPRESHTIQNSRPQPVPEPVVRNSTAGSTKAKQAAETPVPKRQEQLVVPSAVAVPAQPPQKSPPQNRVVVQPSQPTTNQTPTSTSTRESSPGLVDRVKNYFSTSTTPNRSQPAPKAPVRAPAPKESEDVVIFGEVLPRVSENAPIPRERTCGIQVGANVDFLVSQILVDCHRPEVIEEARVQWLVKDSTGGYKFNSTMQDFYDLYHERSGDTPRLNKYKIAKGLVENTYGFHSIVMAKTLAESHFREGAVSTKGAFSVWQLMPDTAKGYNVYPSDRSNINKTTYAAMTYLRTTMDTPGINWDFKLAVAGYNMGHNGMSAKTRDPRLANVSNRTTGLNEEFLSLVRYKTNFWEMRKFNMLLYETAHHVPKVLSGAQLLMAPEVFGARAPYEAPPISITPKTKIKL